MLMTAPRHLTDDDLISAIASLAAVEREATATLIAHLAELEARRLHLAQGFRSLFGYCRHVLHCSEAEAYNRMQTVHAARRFPVILPLLAGGLLHLTAVRLLAPHLRDEDHLALLGGAIHKSRREVVALLARWFPSPDVASSVRKLPAARVTLAVSSSGVTADKAATSEAETGQAATASASGSGAGRAVTDGAPQPEAPGVPTPDPEATHPNTATLASSRGRLPATVRSAVAPLSEDRYRLQVTLDDAAHADLRCLQDMMRREIPDGDPAAIVARALRLLREEAERKAFSATTRPRAGGSARPGSRDIPAHVDRTVWLRDGGQCAFEGAKARCPERSFLEFHHLTPWAAGGPPSAENISLRCRAHNAYEAALYFGPIRAAIAGRSENSFRNESVPRRIGSGWPVSRSPGG